ncbi:hypothetical protein CNEONATNEC26_00621 [Clostridium neonatale]|nr:hypothetical protein CNEO_210111 [Clostridium neonatale]CAG9712138.1 hypothetical protein CNEO_160059 [Clostridium neonatale]SUQ45191.1 hypothetical protein CNEONATNEC26_00621 [Clostridium neonatale]
MNNFTFTNNLLIISVKIKNISINEINPVELFHFYFIINVRLIVAFFKMAKMYVI